MKSKLTHDIFLRQASDIFGEKYDYSKVELYQSSGKLNKEIEIICPIHGSFFKSAWRHIGSKQGCQKCSRKKTQSGSIIKFVAKDFIKLAEDTHGKKYDYSKVIDIDTAGLSNKVPVMCNEHGIFYQKAGKHISGQGCGRCGGTGKLTLCDVLLKAKTIHHNRYDYSKITEYSHLRTYKTIICPFHGEFSQLLINHLSGAGCRKCNLSKGEILIEKSLQELGIDSYVCEKTFEGLFNPTTGKKLRYDFYLPKYNLLIEYDGEQHFYPAYFNKFQTKEAALLDLDEIKKRDIIKTDFAKKHNIKLLRILYSQKKNNITQLIKEML